MTVKEELHLLVDRLDEAAARAALDDLRWLLEEDETLTDEELEDVRRGADEIARGEYVTLNELRRMIRE